MGCLPHSLTNISGLRYDAMTSKNGLQTDEPAGLPLQPRLNPRQRILVAEDNEDIRGLNAEMLVCSGYKVDAVADGTDAWEVLQLNRYDLLVTDYNMPKISGIDLLLKLHAVRMSLPVILVSGTIPTEKLKRYPWLQIDATLLKPYTPDELLAKVRYVLHMTNVTAGQTAPPPDWQDQPADQRLQA